MDPTKARELHGQLRENSEELNDYIRDLNNWLKDIKKTDEDLRNKQHEVADHDYPPIRNSSMASQTEMEKNSKNSSKTNTKCKKKQKSVANHDTTVKDESNKEDKSSELEKVESDSSTDAGDEEIEHRQMMAKAEMQKEKGNQFFKEGKYDEAINCYTSGLQCDPTNAILPANRAMALMKKGQLAAAEADCTQSIAQDPTYIKAFHRRGTCRFGLKKYQLARQDFLKVMELDPGNKLAKAELAKLEKIFQNKKPKERSSVTLPQPKVSPTEKPPPDTCEVNAITKPPHLQSKKPLKRIKIELKNKEEKVRTVSSVKSPENEFLKEVIPSQPSKKITSPINEVVIISPTATPALPAQPQSAFQFLADWKKLHRFPDLQLQYIKQLPPTELPKIFKEAMESDILSAILHVLQSNVSEFSNEMILSYLRNIPDVGRFSTVSLFLSDEEKKGIRLLVEGVINGKSEEASNLLRLYRIV